MHTQRTLPPENIAPRQDALDSDKVARLTEDMEQRGYCGRPLLVVDYGDHYRAITGSHRLAAASSLGIDVPCLVIEYNSTTEDDLDYVLATDDWDGVAPLTRLSATMGAVYELESAQDE
jgi:ParB-like chromosome segregation protein Spo0J